MGTFMWAGLLAKPYIGLCGREYDLGEQPLTRSQEGHVPAT